MSDTMSGETVCEKCGKNYSAKKNLYAHLRKVHNIFPKIPKAEAKIWCAVCGKGFSFKSNLYVHMKKFHIEVVNKSDERLVISGDEVDSVVEATLERTKRIVCPGCNKTFTTSSNLNRHLRNSHLEEYGIEVVGQVMCFFCKKNIMGGHLFHSHLKDDHGVKIDVEFHLFNTMRDFEVWRKNIEVNTKSLYVKIKGNDNRNPNKVISTYYCNRSGKARVMKLEGKKRKKSRPSAKIDSSCPSQIVLVRSSDLLKVKFVKTHIGHAADERFLKSKNRNKIALLGRTSESVLQGAIVPTGGDLSSLSDCSSLSLMQLEDETRFFQELDQKLSAQAVTKSTNQIRNCRDFCNQPTNAGDMNLMFSSTLVENCLNEMEMLPDLSLHQRESGGDIIIPIQEVTVVTSL